MHLTFKILTLKLMTKWLYKSIMLIIVTIFEG